jgi:hypothetical protein
MEKVENGIGDLFLIFIAIIITLCLLIIYPLWKLFALITKFIKVEVEGVRNNDGRLETPVVLYEHPDTKRKIVFIGTIHIGEKEYFDSLQRLIDLYSLCGYKVFFERVRYLSKEEEQKLTPKEQCILMSLDHNFERLDKIAQIMYLKHQREGLHYNDDWINADISVYNLVRLLARYNINPGKEGVSDNLLNESMQPLLRWLINQLFSQFVLITIIDKVFSFFSRKKRISNKIVVDFRNKKLISSIKKVDGNVIIIFGSGHLRGIGRWLKKLGFRETRREWYAAYNIRRDYKFLQCFQEALAIRYK